MPFSSLGLSESLLESIKKQGFTKPYPIQQKAIPAVLQQKDVLGIAQTGSGKTASYALPIINKLQKDSYTKNRHVNVLVLVPTRELANQVSDVFKQFTKDIPERIKTLPVFGGVSINPQMIALQNVNVLVATPGRLLELAESNAVSLSEISTLVLDEADRMLSMGFKEEMDKVFGLLPDNRQNLLFSATLNDDVKNINQMLLDNPEVIKIDPEEVNIELIKQTGYFVEAEKKGPLLRHLITENDMQQVLVFTSSQYQADNVAHKLRRNGIDANAIHGKKSQGSRTDLLNKFKNGRIRVLVATDLLARGIDIEFLPYVINYELPRSPKDFIHRIGRTGRAESPGQAITFVSEEEKHHFRVIQKKMKRWVDMIESSQLEF